MMTHAKRRKVICNVYKTFSGFYLAVEVPFLNKQFDISGCQCMDKNGKLYQLLRKLFNSSYQSRDYGAIYKTSHHLLALEQIDELKALAYRTINLNKTKRIKLEIY